MSILPSRFNLHLAPSGSWLRVIGINPACLEKARLQELGFFESTLIRKISETNLILCQIRGMRVVLGAELGRHIQVETTTML